jgi:TPR repeat protein
MRISDHILPVALLSFGLGLSTAYALDGSKSQSNAMPGIPGARETPSGADVPQVGLDSPNLKSWYQKVRLGDVEGAAKLLEEAARKGEVAAVWKLGRNYADGEGGVKKDDRRAFENFRSIAESQRVEDLVGTQLAPFVANALVSLGNYYLEGIPNSDIKSDAVQARQQFFYAANYFGDPTAQYQLGRMFLDGQGGAKDAKLALRWIYQAVQKGQYEAQAVFGAMLFKGQGQVLPRDGAHGLMWLIIAKETSASAPKGTWIKDQYNAAWSQATPEEQAVAQVYVEQYRRDHARHAGRTE